MLLAFAELKTLCFVFDVLMHAAHYRFYDNAPYKSTIYLLTYTYLLCKIPEVSVVMRAHWLTCEQLPQHAADMKQKRLGGRQETLEKSVIESEREFKLKGIQPSEDDVDTSIVSLLSFFVSNFLWT